MQRLRKEVLQVDAGRCVTGDRQPSPAALRIAATFNQTRRRDGGVRAVVRRDFGE